MHPAQESHPIRVPRPSHSKSKTTLLNTTIQYAVVRHQALMTSPKSAEDHDEGYIGAHHKRSDLLSSDPILSFVQHLAIEHFFQPMFTHPIG